MNPVVDIENLKVKFGDSWALSGVNLAFDRGSIHALLGPNGAGKTTIFKAILGAVDYEGVTVSYTHLTLPTKRIV